MLISKSDLQVYLTDQIRRFTRYHAVKNSVGLSELLVCQPHATKGLIIQDIDTTAAVHEDFGEFVATHLWCYH